MVRVVGAGIGVTPFASIMRSIEMQMRAKDGRSGTGEPTETHFFWICRSQVEFDSFKNLLTGIQKETSFKKLFHFHLYISGELNLTEDKVQDEMKSYSKWAQMWSGRPKWDRIFKEVKAGAEKRLGTTLPTGEPRRREIGVFLCGPSAIGKQLKKAARKHSTPQREAGGTLFSFHMELF